MKKTLIKTQMVRMLIKVYRKIFQQKHPCLWLY